MKLRILAPLRVAAALVVMLFATNCLPAAAAYADEMNSSYQPSTSNNNQQQTQTEAPKPADPSEPMIDKNPVKQFQAPEQNNDNHDHDYPQCAMHVDRSKIVAAYTTDQYHASVTYTGMRLCDHVTDVVSLNSYQTEGATWPTSGTQTFVDHDQVIISKDNTSGMLSVKSVSCFYQTDLYFGSTRYDGNDGQIPHYPSPAVPNNLIAARNGGAACTSVTPAAPSFTEVCGTDKDTYTIPTTEGVDYYVNGVKKAAGTYQGSGNVVITAKAANYNFVLKGQTSWSHYFSSEPCPTVHQCVVTTSGGEITNSNRQGFDFSETRSTGHYVFTDNGLHIYTESNTSTDKVAAYKAVDVSLADVGAPALDYTSNSGINPGFQLVIDFNGDGTPDGTLVGETIYGNDWWLTDGSAAFVKAGAPSHTGGSGSANHGTLDQWLTAFPQARVKAFGFSLGSGVKADGVLKSITFNCQKYTFKADKPVPPVTDVCVNIPGIQTTVPTGYQVSNGNCVVTTTGGSGGDVLGASTVATPAVVTKLVTTKPAELANTGDSSVITTVAVGLIAITAALGLTLASRKQQLN